MSAPIISWMQKPDLRPSPEQLLSDRIDKIRADFERPRLRVVGCEVIVEQPPRPMNYWRERQKENLRTQNAVLRRKIERIRQCRKK